MKWESDSLPSTSLSTSTRPRRSKTMQRLLFLGGLSVIALVLCYSRLYDGFQSTVFHHKHHHHKPQNAHEITARCRQLRTRAGPPDDFGRRSTSDRFEEGTRPVLIKNAKIWTGKRNGTEVIDGDILIDKGIIESIGHLDVTSDLVASYSGRLDVVDAKGAWLTPGIVDIHSHLGVSSSPELSGSDDSNSLKGTIEPWLRSLDGLNTHDEAYPLSIAGGVTTALILPGSANAIGGQAYVMKLRETSERSPSSMLLEPPYHINASFPNPNLPRSWRHMKHACGENPGSVYSDTRMDTIWALREAYTAAKKAKDDQDNFCSRALSDDWKDLGVFPEALKWEASVDVLRGRVKVNIHCYEAVDLDGFVRLSNEFKFPIAAFHHASEAYLVPDLIKRAYGKTPAVALFATNSRYKREAYRSSEFAPRILAERGLTVLMKSDHPIMDSRHLLYEAQQAFYYGLPYNLALASVITNSAEVMGMGHRIGYIKEGYDADLVIWDSHPLALGATPKQVFIDGIPQLGRAFVTKKPDNFQKIPRVPNFRKEAERVVAYDGLPPLEVKKTPIEKATVFLNVKTVTRRTQIGVQTSFTAQPGAVEGPNSSLGVVLVEKGRIACAGDQATCGLHTLRERKDIEYVDLEGGSIAPGLVTFGSPVGLEQINEEPSTNDGAIYDSLTDSVPALLGGNTAVVRASDGLDFGSRDALLAYRFGVTSAITAPKSKGFFGGLGVHFSTGASSRLEGGAVIQEITAVHVAVRHFGKPSISTQVAALRRLLQGKADGAAGHYFGLVRTGQIPLVIEAHSADIIATLVILKKEIEVDTRKLIKMTITGGAEAHLLAAELAEAGVGVILVPSRSFPYTWENRRILPGPPLTNQSSIEALMDHGVVVAIGCQEIWEARNLPFDVAWAAIESGGRITREDAFAIGSWNVERLLGVERDHESVDLVATRGGDFLDSHAKVVAIISPDSQTVNMVD
ncbi:amidohydrolase [Ephemerocybe angulata]|uniref:Amidohydrolase n=1 Tax=Ephemerocybe angulata TaxID=980116 RepID=A0A8H6IC91_9AGAR|nr:amidohydrolase [Tulosesus angulatus]